MKPCSIKFLIVFFFGCNTVVFSQVTEIIRVKRDNQFIYFFQKGNKSDTISKNRGDFFYLVVPDSLKEFISIQTDNGQLMSTANDSLVKFNFIKGIKYELVFSEKEEGQRSKAKKKYVYKTLINGAVVDPDNKVIIRIIDKRENALLMENRFLFKDELQKQ